MVRLNTASALGGAGTGAIYAGLPGMIAGGIAGLFSGGGGSKKPKRVSTLDPTQQGLYKDYAAALRGEGGPLADIYGPADLDKLRQLYQEKYAQPAYQSWQENVVPGITGQFRGGSRFGGGNLQNSSYLGGALAKSGENLQRGLNADLEELLYNSQQAATNRRAGGVQNILNMNTFDYKKKERSLIDELLTSLSGGAGNLLANSPLFRGNSNPPGISGGGVRIGQPARGY